MRPVVVYDDMKLPVGVLRGNMLEELQEFLISVPAVTLICHPSRGDFQRREQTRFSVTFIVMRTMLGQPWHDREHRPGPLQRLDLRLLVNTEHDSVLGRIHVKPDDIGDLRVQLGVCGKLERLRAMRLNTPVAPDSSYLVMADADALGQFTARPVRQP